jgi:hypothetical protein
MNWQPWKNFDTEIRKLEFTTLFFNEGLALKPGGISVFLTSLGKGTPTATYLSAFRRLVCSLIVICCISTVSDTSAAVT